MLAIELEFLTGRYVATAHNTRTSSEWPPHPARLFSALVATHHELAFPDPRERVALEWLEQLGAPHISSSEATQRDVVTTFVPVNDIALTNVDDEAFRRDEAREALLAAAARGDARAIKKCEAAVRKTEAALARAIASQTDAPVRSSNSRYGQRLLPEYRTRQPRTLPSMTPVTPRVVYFWPEASADEGIRSSLGGLLRRVTRLGHSSSLVTATLADEAPPAAWVPAADGEVALRVVEAGQLVALERAFDRHRETEPRVLPARFQPYARPSDAPETVGLSHFSDDWLVLRRIAGPTVPVTATAGIARAVRRTLMSFADEPIREVLAGHSLDGRPSADAHLAVVPLPFVGHPHATGALLGVALVFPRDTSNEDRRAVFIALRRWEDAHRIEDEDAPAVPLVLGSVGELRLERVESSTVAASLKPAVWCAAARTWSSVTPVALDRNPGDLHSRDADASRAARRSAEEVIRLACARIGLPAVRAVEILPAAPWAGAAKTRHYPRYPMDVDRTQRVLTHVRVHFDSPVRGPVLLGAGRFAGLGLLRPEVSG